MVGIGTFVFTDYFYRDHQGQGRYNRQRIRESRSPAFYGDEGVKGKAQECTSWKGLPPQQVQ